MIVRQGTLAFSSFKGTGPQRTEQALNSPLAAQPGVALLAGFDVQFADDDHHLHLLEVDVQSRSLSSYASEITGTLGLRDASGHWDDRYAETIRYALVHPETPEQILGGTLSFPAAEGSGPRTLNESVQFAQSVDEAVGVLTGFLARFSTDDHHLLELESDIDAQSPAPDQLQISGTFGLRDSSGSWDDKYDGELRYAALGTVRTDMGMAQLRTGRVDFSPQSGQGPRQHTQKIGFSNPVGDCVAVLTGFSVGYDKNDHHFQRAVIEAEARKMSDREVEVICTLGLKDTSGHWDDAYRGSVRFAVLGS